MPSVTSLAIAPPVRDAIASGAAVVALESAVITHGLPKAAAIDAVRRQWEACEKANATPAVVAVFGGELRVGLSLDQCALLAGRTDAVKVSPWNLASAMVSSGFGGTTVAATIVAAARSGIRVVSTGGIGGGHPGGGQDVSSGLTGLGRQPVGVVCAGPKSTVDAGATLGRLGTVGGPRNGRGSDRIGGTTVAATIVAAARSGIRVVSTGGIGGVHPGDGQDVSSDLTELGRQPVCVVCAGPKSTLDAGATLERLETLGVPVIGWRSSLLAGFLPTAARLPLPPPGPAARHP